MKTMQTLAKPGFRRQHAPAGRVVDQQLESPYFTCPACEAKGEDPVHRVESSRVVEGNRYCTICGDALVDEVVFRALTQALDGVVTWGKGRHEHELHASLQNIAGEVEFMVATTCNCHNVGTITEHHPNFSEFFDAFTTFVEDPKHFTAIKAIVTKEDA